MLTLFVCLCVLCCLPCSALDPLQAELYGSGQYVAVEDPEGACETTDHTVDMLQTALLLVQVIASALPAAVDPDQYNMGVQVPTDS